MRRLIMLAVPLMALIGLSLPAAGRHQRHLRREQPSVRRLRGQPGLRLHRDPAVADGHAHGRTLLQRQHVGPRHQHHDRCPAGPGQLRPEPDQHAGGAADLVRRRLLLRSPVGDRRQGWPARTSTPTTSRSSSSGSRAATRRPAARAPTSAARSRHRPPCGQYGALPEANLVDTLAANTAGRRGRLRRAGLRQRRRSLRPELQEVRRCVGDPLLRTDHAGREQRHALATSSSSCTRTRAAPASATPVVPTCSAAPTSSSAVNSFVANAICSGNTYSYRVDTPEALAWITSTAIAHGGGF